MNTTFKTLGLFLLILALFILFNSLFIVHEGQNALLLRLGEIVEDSAGNPRIEKPGIHFKIPFLNQVRKFDVRLQTLAMQSSRILTKEQKYVLVDDYAKWRIENLALYFKRTGGFPSRAQILLQQQINDALRAAFGKRTITEVISGERINIMTLLKEAANKNAHNLGIEVIDVRIKRIDLPKEVSSSVFARMSAQREQVAAEHRARGKAQGEAIRAKADAEVTVIIASAKKKAAEILAQGVAKAANIYAYAYTKDAKFYTFYKSMEAYRHTFNSKNDLLLLSPDNSFFSYLKAAIKKDHNGS